MTTSKSCWPHRTQIPHKNLVFFLTASIICLLAPSSPLAGQPLARWDIKKDALTLWVTGVYRPRFEWMQRRDLKEPDGVDARKDDVFINHRARLGVGASIFKRARVYFQIQDIRRWGTSPDDFSADGFDIHRVWLDAQIAGPLSVKLGRMELVYDGKRLLGNADWRPHARNFDAIQLKFEPKHYQLHLVYTKLSDTGYPTDDQHMTMAWFRFHSLKAFQPSLYYMMHYTPENKGLRHTTGAYVKGQVSGFSYTGEFYLQFGGFEDAGNNRDIFAWLGAFSLEYQLSHAMKPTFIVWAEWLSGQEEGTSDKTLRSFVTTFGNNHKHYGWMDFFLNIPNNNNNAGLVDIGGGLRLAPHKTLFLRLDVHYFRLFSPLTNPSGDKVQDLGVESNLTAQYTVIKNHLSMLVVYGLMLPFANQGFSALGKGNNPEHWLAIQTEVKF